MSTADLLASTDPTGRTAAAIAGRATQPANATSAGAGFAAQMQQALAASATNAPSVGVAVSDAAPVDPSAAPSATAATAAPVQCMVQADPECVVQAGSEQTGETMPLQTKRAAPSQPTVKSKSAAKGEPETTEDDDETARLLPLPTAAAPVVAATEPPAKLAGPSASPDPAAPAAPDAGKEAAPSMVAPPTRASTSPLQPSAEPPPASERETAAPVLATSAHPAAQNAAQDSAQHAAQHTAMTADAAQMSAATLASHATTPMPAAAPAPPQPAGPAPQSPSQPVPTPARQVAAAVTDPVQVTLAAPSASGGNQSLTIQLKPVELGRVEIRIERSAEGPTIVHLAVERTDTLMTLVRDQPLLHQALDQAGVPQEGRTVQFSLAADAPTPAAGAGSSLLGDGGSSGGQRSGYGHGGRGGHGSFADPDGTATHSVWTRSGLDITA